MPEENQAKRRSVAFFAATRLNDPLAGGGETALTQVSYDREEDADIFRAGQALTLPHMKTFATDLDDAGLHLGVTEFAPGLIIPLHSHSDNCLYYVERGSVVMGGRTLGPGEGFLARKDQPYGFVVGPDGLRLLEFTTGPRPNIAYHDRNPAVWKRRLDKAVEKLAID
jgi:hypothetical protein